MDLKIKDVADLLNISETTVRRWVGDGKIPAYRLNHQYRFNRNEIENWVLSNKLGQATDESSFDSDEIAICDLSEEGQIQANQNSGIKQYSLYRAIHKGGVYHNVPGSTKEEVIRATMSAVEKRLDFDGEVLTDLLLDREQLMPTALGNGVGVPHTRDFLLKQHFDAIVVVFPEKPIEYGALDALPVDTLFFLFACEDKRHLHLLAKLAHLSSKRDFLEELRQSTSERDLLQKVLNWEKNLNLVTAS